MTSEARDTLRVMPGSAEMRDYPAWRQRHAQWRQRTRLRGPHLHHPLFTVAVDCSAGDVRALSSTVESLLAQRYRNVEITLCGVPSGADSAGLPELDQWTVAGHEFRGLLWEPDAVATHALSSAAAGACAPASRGDFVMCLPAGATLDADCFDEVCHALHAADLDADPGLVLIDHDSEAADGGALEPHLLWNWGLDQLQACDLIGPSFMVSRACVEARGGAPCPSVRAWMLNLMRSGREPEIVHVAAPVVHVRASGVAASAANRRHAAGDVGSPATVSPGGEGQSRTGVSVIIPTRNRADLLRECLAGLSEPNRDMEVVVVDNGSDEPDAIALLQDLEGREGFTVVRSPGAFNFSQLVNEGVASSRHPAIMLLNNDVRVGEWGRVAHLVDYLWLAGVGVVGTTLHYPDGSVQHAGMAFSQPRAAHHVMRGAVPGSEGYALAHAHPRSVQAVTGALMLIRREVFDSLGGFDACNLPVEWNDVDFCLRARHAGWRVVCVPSEGIVHDESASRRSHAAEEVLRMRRSAEDRMMTIWSALGVRVPFACSNVTVEDVDRPLLREPA